MWDRAGLLVRWYKIQSVRGTEPIQEAHNTVKYRNIILSQTADGIALMLVRKEKGG